MKKEFAQRVSLNIEKQIATVSLINASKFNALDKPTLEALVKACHLISKDSSVRVVILRGEGKAFCSGLDVKSVMKQPLAIKDLLNKPVGRPENLVQRAVLCWRELPVPVITVTQGYCYGGGFQLALAADFRLSTHDCKFSILESKWGLIPDMGASVLLRELIPIDQAKELTISARVFDGEEAKSMNLVTQLHDDPLAAAQKMAEDIKQKSPDAVAATKHLFNNAWLATVPEALEVESTLQKKLVGGWNQLAAASKQFVKKPLPFRKQKIIKSK